MLLAIDIGNTRTTFALLRNHLVVAEEHVSSTRLPFRRARDIVRTLTEKFSGEKISAVGIASVVPQLTDLVSNAAAEITGAEPRIITATAMTIALNYSAPEKIGADRLCNCVAAFHETHGATIVIDCGTAVTLDCIDDTGAFLGGAILPGYRTATRALAAITAQLPDIMLAAPDRALGTSTDECLRSGIVLGTTFAIEGLIHRIVDESYNKIFPALIATGGHATIFSSTTSLPVKVMPDLVLQGVALVMEQQ